MLIIEDDDGDVVNDADRLNCWSCSCCCRRIDVDDDPLEPLERHDSLFDFDDGLVHMIPYLLLRLGSCGFPHARYSCCEDADFKGDDDGRERGGTYDEW